MTTLATTATKQTSPLTVQSLCRGSLDETSHVHFTAPDAWSPAELIKTQQLWGLNATQLSKVQELGHRLSDIQHYKNCPDVAVRFLIPHKYNLEHAERMFRQMIAWRRQFRVDSIAKPDDDLIQYFPGAILAGRDRDGDPIFCNRNGAVNAAQLFERYGREEFLHYVIWIRELVSHGAWRAAYEETTKPAKMITIIDDLEGLKWWSILRHPSILRAFAEGMRIDQDYYPEGAKRIIVIRCPGMFETIWNITKHVFDPNVRVKMVFCSKSNYESVLSQYMDLAVLPREVTLQGRGTVDIDMPESFTGVWPDHSENDDIAIKKNKKKSTNLKADFPRKQRTSSSSNDEDDAALR